MSKSWRNLRLHMKLALAALKDRRDGPAPDGLPVPSPKLRYRVHGFISRESFLQVGMQCSQDLQKLLQILNRDSCSFENILDFGCGCGRVSRYFFDHHASSRFYGTDIDSEAIAWCKAHLPNLAQWNSNDHLPPTVYGSNTFDLIYGVSVFTHLDEERQLAWLAELKRISKHGGVIILTVHGSAYYDSVAMPEKGFLYKTRRTGAFRVCGLPDYYQTTYQTKQYIEQEWSRFFTLRHYAERGMNAHQDAVILANDL